MLNANILKIWRETGRLLAIFLIGAAGTLTGAIVGTILLSNSVEGLAGVAAMMTGSYIGGGVNQDIMAAENKTENDLLSPMRIFAKKHGIEETSKGVFELEGKYVKFLDK